MSGFSCPVAAAVLVLAGLAPAITVAEPASAVVAGMAKGSRLPIGRTNGVTVGDLNGDGRADLFRYDADTTLWYAAYSGQGPWVQINGGSLDQGATWLADMNGDGRDDVFSKFTNNQWAVSWSGTSAWVGLAVGSFDPAATWITDMNGDGVDDVFTKFATDQWMVSYGGTQNWAQINGGYFNPATTWVADINGDNRSDVFGLPFGGTGWAVSYGGNTSWQIINGGWFDTTKTWLADMNGDGSADVFSVPWPNQWAVSHSGTGGWVGLANGSFDPSKTWLADFNGDHKADVMSYLWDTQFAVSYSGTGSWTTLLDETPACRSSASPTAPLSWTPRVNVTFNFKVQTGDSRCEDPTGGTRQGVYRTANVWIDGNNNLVISARRHCSWRPITNSSPINAAPCANPNDTKYSIGRMHLVSASGASSTPEGYFKTGVNFEWGFEAKVPQQSAPGARSAMWVRNASADSGACNDSYGEFDVLEWYSKTPASGTYTTHLRCWTNPDGTRDTQKFSNSTAIPSGNSGWHRWSVKKAGITSGPTNTVTVTYKVDSTTLNTLVCRTSIVNSPDSTCNAIMSQGWMGMIQTAVFTKDSGLFLGPTAGVDFPTQNLLIRDMWISQPAS